MSRSAGKSILTENEKRELEGYDFQFENIVLEGGGSKTTAYIGAIRVFEELGIWPRIRRFAGAGAGSLVASLLVIGYNSHELQELLREDMKSIVHDAKLGMVEKMSNFYRKMGLHPGKKLVEWLGDRYREKCGNPDITFRELYKKYGRELCVVAVSLNKMDTEYFHVKTTPDMPIRLAVRASTTIPGLVVPVKFKAMSNDEDVYVDGGLLCNYPISCFDGWYLSMAPDDSFLHRIDDLFNQGEAWNKHNWFREPVNTKTVGLELYANRERDLLKKELEERRKKYCTKSDIVSVPDTHLSRKRTDEAVQRETLSAVSEDAVKKLMNLLKRHDSDGNGTISREEFRQSMSESSDRRGSFTNNDFEALFGDTPADADVIFDQLDVNKNGEIEFSELIAFAERKGLDIMAVYRGYERRDSFNDIGTMFQAIVETLVINANRASEKNTNLDRTVGINTHYIHDMDGHLEQADKQFLVECGKQGIVCFLRSYMATNQL